MVPLEFFRRQKTAYPEIDFLVSAAVGFPASVYWMGAAGPGGKGTEYQVMRWDERPGPGLEFWSHHLDTARQFYPTPLAAAASFVAAWHARSRRDALAPVEAP